jgi:hypothetical protein
MRLAVALEIFSGVLKLHAMPLKESVHLHASFKPKNTAKLGCGELVFAIRFEGNSLKCGAAEISVRSTQGGG